MKDNPIYSDDYFDTFCDCVDQPVTPEWWADAPSIWDDEEVDEDA